MMKSKICLSYLILMLLCVGIIAKEFEVSVKFNSPTIIKSGNYHQIIMSGTETWLEEGKPEIPFYTANILIPFGEKVKDISLVKGTKVTVPGKYVIIPSGKPEPFSEMQGNTPAVEDSSIYNFNKLFPTICYHEKELQVKNGYQILPVNLFPTTFNPIKKEISWYKNLKIVITTEALERTATSPIPRNKQFDIDEIKKIVENDEAVDSYTIQASPTHEATSSVNYEYVIITSKDFKDYTGVNSLTDLLNHKISKGLTGIIVSTEWIGANYSGIRPDGTEDLQTKIRNCIKDAYENYGTKYVLLAGDADGENKGKESQDPIIPYRYLISKRYTSHWDSIPSDLYYSNLDGSFDGNANGIYGESDDGEDGGDIDLLSEVFVGRVPIDNIVELQNFVRKTIQYETSNSSYHKNVFMVGEKLGNNWYAKSDIEMIIDGTEEHTGFNNSHYKNFFTIDTMFDIDYIDELDREWTKEEILNKLNTKNNHIINHLGHSYWIKNMKFFNGDVDALNNLEPFFHYSQGCNTMAFDNYVLYSNPNDCYYSDVDCIGEHYVTQSNAAFAMVGNARYGWSKGYSNGYNQAFWDKVLGEHVYNLGKAHQLSKEEFSGVASETFYRWCYFSISLFGDPETSLHIKNSENGKIFFTDDVYSLNKSAEIMVVDRIAGLDPKVIDQITVSIASTNTGDNITLTLSEVTPNSTIFKGTLNFTTESGNQSALQVNNSDVVIAQYLDLDDGEGNSNVVKQTTANIDINAPVIINSSIEVGEFKSYFQWETDENAKFTVIYGNSIQNLDMSVTSEEFTLNTQLEIDYLKPNTKYFYYISYVDEYGNEYLDNNNGECYSFNTEEWSFDGTLSSILSDNIGYILKKGNVLFLRADSLYFYDGVSTELITVNSNIGSYNFYENRIAWCDRRTIYLNENNQTTEIYNDDPNSYDYISHLLIDSKYIAWHKGDFNFKEIMLYDGTTSEVISERTENSLKGMQNGKVVWQKGYQYDPRIIYYNGKEALDIGEGMNPHMDIYGSIVWKDYDKIYKFDGEEAVVIIENNSFSKNEPKIFGDNIIWREYDPNGQFSSVKLFDGNSIKQISTEGRNCYYPTLNGDQAVWTEEDGNDREIYYWDGVETIQLTNNNYHDYNPQVSNNYISWTANDTIVVAQIAPLKNVRLKKTYNSLQTAIDEANPGDMIRVQAGAKLNETVNINNKSNIVIKGNSCVDTDRASLSHYAGIPLKISNSQNIDISNIKISGRWRAVDIENNSREITIENSYISGGQVAINALNSKKLKVSNNYIQGGATCGLSFYVCDSSLVMKNIVDGFNGIVFSQSYHNEIYHNTVTFAQMNGIQARGVNFLSNNIVMNSMTGLDLDGAVIAGSSILFNTQTNNIGNHDDNIWYENPNLDENNVPQENSIALDNGILISGINDEYEGIAPDIGANESSFKIDEWSHPVNYSLGDRVFYNNKIWTCIVAHQSNETWAPGFPGVYLWE